MLDTNICIYLIKKKPARVLEKLKEFNIGDFSISSVTLAELEYGVKKSKFEAQNRVALTNFLAPFEILPFGQSAAIEYGKIRANLEKRGQIIGAYDLMIGAHARAEKLTLVTNNIKEFKRVTDLQVENWVQ